MKDIMIKITSHIKQMGGEEDTIEFVTEGKFKKTGQTINILYKESEISGMAGSKTSLKINGDKVTMKRLGSGASEMVFEVGERKHSDYVTPYGNFEMELKTKSIVNEMEINDDELKGFIAVSYALVIKNLSESINFLKVEILS